MSEADLNVEIVRKMENQKGFEVLPRRWVVERTFAWMTRWRRLVRDYEQRLDVSEAIRQIQSERQARAGEQAPPAARRDCRDMDCWPR